MSAASLVAIADTIRARALDYTDAAHPAPLSARFAARLYYGNRSRQAAPFPYMTLEPSLSDGAAVDGAVDVEGDWVLTVYERPETPAAAGTAWATADQLHAAFADFRDVTYGFLSVWVRSRSPLPSAAGTLGGQEVDAQVDGTRFVLAVRAIGFGPLVTAAA